MANRQQNLRVVDPVLSNLALGYSNAELIAGELFPMAQVPKEAGLIPKFNQDHFKQYNTERALRARSNVMQPSDRTFIPFSLDEHDLSVPMDYREGDEADFDLEASNALIATEAIALRRELQASQLAFSAANYAATNKITLSGASQFSAAGSDPIGVVENGKEAIRKRIARRPNTVTMGATTYSVLKNHPQLLDRIKYSMTGIVTADLMAQVFGVDRILIGNAIGVDDAGNPFDIWGDNLLLTYGRPAAAGVKRSYYEPNFAYTLYKRMGEMDKYEGEGGKVTYVRNTSIYKTVLVGADAGYLISDTNA